MIAATVLSGGFLVAGGLALTWGHGMPAVVAGAVAVLCVAGAVTCVAAVRATNRRDGTAHTIFTV